VHEVLRLAALLAGVALAAALPTAAATQPGAVSLRAIDFGEYFEYVPQRKPRAVLVLAHGSVDERQAEQDVRNVARSFAMRWRTFAEDHGLIVVAPVFGHDFGSWINESDIAHGGYRALAGKRIGADEFVHRIVDRYASRVSVDRFYLYGHSAGGQFAGRYAITHPERVRALVLSAPGRYAFPDPRAPWPYGQRDGGNGRPPVPENWRKAAALPITVVVGGKDTDPQPRRPDHPGRTRIEYARHWVEAMSKLAPPANPIRLVIVPGIAHSSAGLTPACQEALARTLSAGA
jgi:pimeloyl-ACP methyl ester carboxylesterase